MGGSAVEIAPGVLVDRISEVLKFVPALSVAGTVPRVGVSEPARDLDNDRLRGVQEVDTGDMATIAADPALSLGSRQSRLSYQRQEPSFQDTLAAGVEEQSVESPNAMPTATSQVGQSFHEHERGRQPLAHGAVDRRG